MDREYLFFNGINGESGDYDIPPLTGEEFSRLIQGEAPAENLEELRFRYKQGIDAHYGIMESLDPNNLAEAGWGAIFPHAADPQMIEALQPLLELRKSQAGSYFKIFEGPGGYRPGETKNDFLKRYNVGPGPADPAKMPYYLLLVGSPEQIPFSFQTQLDVQYSVGRIYFDTVQEYENYAASVVASESGKVRLPRQAAFFGVRNYGDGATALSSEYLMRPLVEYLSNRYPEWQLNTYMADQATRSQLDLLLGRDPAATPALLFSASHGMSFPIGSPRQLWQQGALLCQDWPGPERWKGPVPEKYYFAGDHLPSDRNLLGMVAFLYACYGGGTPRMDQFSKQYFKDRAAIAPSAFLARLPVKMLGLPRGGALAVVGHIDRAWGYSFNWTGRGGQTEIFDSALSSLFSGKTIGAAMEYFNERYAEISTVLSDQLEEIEYGSKYDPYELAQMWTANNDSRGYAILGDPAIRLPVVGKDEPVLARQGISVVSSRAVSEEGQLVEKEQLPQAGPVAQSEPVSKGAGVAFSSPAGPDAEPVKKSSSLFDNTPTSKFGSSSIIDTYARMAENIQGFSLRLVELLNNTLSDSTSLQVQTFLEDRLVATTNLSLDGDVRLVLHIKPEELDPNLMAFHTQMVQQARVGQAELLRAMTDAVVKFTTPAK